MGGAGSFAGLVLAAGRGARFLGETGGPLPKVLRPLLGRPMVCHVLDTLAEAGIADVTLVVGFMAEEVRRALGDGVSYVAQAEQKGSGHAASCAADRFRGFEGHLVVMCGDSPLFLPGTIKRIMREHVAAGAAVTLAAAVLEDPFGYGRILRNRAGGVARIVEEKCANEQQRAVREVNGGAYALDSRWLFDNIEKMTANDAGEYNLTDMVRVAVDQGRTVSSVRCDPGELLGVNTAEQLKAVEDMLRRRRAAS